MKKDWKHWFKALAAAISQYDQPTLAKKARNIDWGKGKSAPLTKRYPSEETDPFSLMAYIAQRNGQESRHDLYPRIAAEFGSNTPVANPSNGDLHKGVPYLHDSQMFFFNFVKADNKSTRSKEQEEALFALFRQAVAGKLDPKTRAKVLQIDGVGERKLGIMLHLINAEVFPRP